MFVLFVYLSHAYLISVYLVSLYDFRSEKTIECQECFTRNTQACDMFTFK